MKKITYKEITDRGLELSKKEAELLHPLVSQVSQHGGDEPVDVFKANTMAQQSERLKVPDHHVENTDDEVEAHKTKTKESHYKKGENN
jgi:hypothetical protein